MRWPQVVSLCWNVSKVTSLWVFSERYLRRKVGTLPTYLRYVGRSFWLGQVSSSLCSNVSTLTRLWNSSLRMLSNGGVGGYFWRQTHRSVPTSLGRPFLNFGCVRTSKQSHQLSHMRLWWGSKKVKNLRPTFNNQNTKDKAFKTCCASSSHHNYFFVFELNANRKNVFSIFSFGKHLIALLGSQVWWWCVHVIFKVQVPFIIGEIKVSWKKACVEGFEGCGKQSQNNSKKPLYLIWCIKVHVERILVFTMTSSPRFS